jgi:hypothetical protein
MTSAPISTSSRVAAGPARTCVKSRTRWPSRTWRGRFSCMMHLPSTSASAASGPNAVTTMPQAPSSQALDAPCSAAISSPGSSLPRRLLPEPLPVARGNLERVACRRRRAELLRARRRVSDDERGAIALDVDELHRGFVCAVRGSRNGRRSSAEVSDLQERLGPSYFLRGQAGRRATRPHLDDDLLVVLTSGGEGARAGRR